MPSGLSDMLELYKERAVCYPARVLADKIYRNRENLAYCKERSIRLSGPALGRPRMDACIAQHEEEFSFCSVNIIYMMRKTPHTFSAVERVQNEKCHYNHLQLLSILTPAHGLLIANVEQTLVNL